MPEPKSKSAGDSDSAAVVSGRIQTYQEFWPFYLREHSRATTRALHYFGTTLVLALFIYCFATGWLKGLWFAPLIGYGFPWLAHFTIEKNRPATFKYPLWSLISDFKMYFLFVSGKIRPHLVNAGVRI